jgi:hypothetical protein
MRVKSEHARKVEPHSRGPLAILRLIAPKHSLRKEWTACALDGSVGSAVETLDVLIYAYAIPEWTIDIDGHMGFC